MWREAAAAVGGGGFEAGQEIASMGGGGRDEILVEEAPGIFVLPPAPSCFLKAPHTTQRGVTVSLFG